MLGIYYDNPQSLVDPSTNRVSTGYLFRTQDSSELIAFLVEKKGYKKAELPRSSSLHGTFPCKTGLSFCIGAAKFYPALEAYLQANKEQYGQFLEPEHKHGILEEMDPGLIRYHLPTENVPQFYLTPFPIPERKAEFKQKKD